MSSGKERFAAEAERFRRELHVHCYRLLGSFEEAEDAVQETMLRAWRSRETFDGSSLFRAWLYRIATNVCVDQRRQSVRRLSSPAAGTHSMAEVAWLQPYPDRLLDEVAAPVEQPDAQAIERETIELAFLAALQLLPTRQRAALIVRDVLGWPAAETAAVLETSVPAANSALQRARATLQQHLPARRVDWKHPSEHASSGHGPSQAELALLAQFLDAHERCDAAAAAAIAAQDIRVTMPPYAMRFDGLPAVLPLLNRAFGPERDGDWRLLPTAANRHPAAASYLRRPGDTVYRAFKLDVLRISAHQIAEITTFGTVLFPHFGLPATVL